MNVPDFGFIFGLIIQSPIKENVTQNFIYFIYAINIVSQSFQSLLNKMISTKLMNLLMYSIFCVNLYFHLIP